MGGLDCGGGQNGVLVGQYEADGKRWQTVDEVGRFLLAVPPGNDVEDFPDIYPAHDEMELALVCLLNERFDGRGSGLVKQPDDDRHESTTLVSAIVSGDFGGSVVGQTGEKIGPAPEHSPHGMPVGMIPDESLQDQCLALNVDGYFGARF